MKSKKSIYLLLLLIISIYLLSGCYMEQDRTANNNQNLGGDKPFQDIVTPTPTATNLPEIPSNTDDPNSTINFEVFGNLNTENIPSESPSTQETSITVTSPPTQSPTITEAPSSDVLKSGSEGTKVKELQQRLKELGYYKGSVDGKFGVGTTTAVKDFQSSNNLNADGVAGKATQTKLFSNNVVKASASTATTKKPSAQTTKKPATVIKTPRPTSMPKINPNTYLQTSSHGSDVRKLQNRLIELGYLAGTADGVYGASTEKAVIAFQKVACRYYDGIAGPDTLEKLFSSKAPKASKVAAVVAKSGSSLREGDEGTDVKSMQKRLIELGYLSGSADGSFGAGTKAALMEFQGKNGLSQDGVAGTGTLNRLFADDAVPANQTSGYLYPNTQAGGVVANNSTKYIENFNTSNFVASGTDYTTLKYGSASSAVSSLQQKLTELGYYNGSIDGKYGSTTAEAISNFQTNNMLNADGIAGPATQRLLFGNVSANQSYPKLQLNDRNKGVSNLQYSLYELGYYQGKITGVYDKITMSAVQDFQENNGLYVDGIAGNETLKLLNSSFAKPQGLAVVSYNTLSLGSREDAVVQLQGRLVDLGYMQEPISGEYDRTTQNAILTFQTYNGLKADGVAGATTQIALYSENAIAKPVN